VGEQAVPHRTPVHKKIDSPVVRPGQPGFSRKPADFQLSLPVLERKHFPLDILPQSLHQPGRRIFPQRVGGQKFSLVEKLEPGMGIGQGSFGQNVPDVAEFGSGTSKISDGRAR
jgi:hypothetical protein